MLVKPPRSLLAPLCTAGICLFSQAAHSAPADTNALLERISNESRVPPMVLKAIAWQESKWTHRLANGAANISGDGGVGIMQVQDGDRSANEEQNIRAGASKLLSKWHLNVSAAARAAVDKLGGLPEDYEPDILENWFVPLAGYNGYSGNATTGQGGGKGYARAIFSMLANPASYKNWRTDGRVEAVAASIQPYFTPRVEITDPAILPGFSGGAAGHIQAYSLCQLVKAGGRIHRYSFSSHTVSDITASIEPRCGPGSLSPHPPAAGGAGLQPWQQTALTYVNNYLEGRAAWKECFDAGAGRHGTYCYRFARQAVGLPAMGSAIDAFESLHDHGQASTASFATAPLGALIFYRIGAFGHVAVKVSATEVAGHGNELAFTGTCPPITKVSHASLLGRASYAGFYAPSGGAISLDPNVISTSQRITRQDFLRQLLAGVRSPVDAAAAGIVQGAALAEPTRPITRGEAFTMLGRALTKLPPALPSAAHAPLAFADAPAGESAALFATLSAHGLIQGQANELAAGVNAFPGRQLSITEAQTVLGRASALLAVKQSTSVSVVTRVEPQGRLIVNSPGTLLFHGQNLSANVAVTLAHCENGKTALVSPVLVRHDCVPREAGPQMAGWKPNALTPAVNSLSTVDVANPIAMVAAAGTLAAKVDAFVATWTGRPVDVDKSYGYQCVDLMHQYAKDVLGKDGDFARGNAYSIFVNTNSTRLKKTLNTPAAVPTKGDVIFWKPSAANGQAGHVAIFLGGDDKSFVSFDQNFCANSGSGTGSCAPRQVSHNYDGVAGWISTSLGTTSVPAVITGMQPQGPLMVNAPATLNFQGQHLTADVRVTLTNCDGGQTQLINDTQIRHQCTPRMAGAQTVSWKASAAEANVRALGTVQVAAAVAPPVSLPLITGMQPQGPLMVNAPATLNFQGQHLTTDVRVTLTNCDGGQTQLINDTQIRHQCTPHMAGAQTVGWKASAAEANVRALGTVQVAAAAVDVRITGLGVNPPSVPTGQAMNFSAALSTTQGVARVDLVFPDVGVTEPMQPSGPNAFSRQRQMTQAGANRQYQVKVTLTNGQSVTQTGSYSVTAQSQPIVPPPPIKTVIGPAPSCTAVAPTQGFVCGADGKRYLNTCTLRVHGIAPNHAGGC